MVAAGHAGVGPQASSRSATVDHTPPSYQFEPQARTQISATDSESPELDEPPVTEIRRDTDETAPDQLGFIDATPRSRDRSAPIAIVLAAGLLAGLFTFKRATYSP